MKMVLFIYNAPLEKQIMRGLREININYYTKWEKVLGAGKSSAARLDTTVWPGYNAALLIYADEKNVIKIREFITDLKKELPKGSISAYVWPLEEVI